MWIGILLVTNFAHISLDDSTKGLSENPHEVEGTSAKKSLSPDKEPFNDINEEGNSATLWEKWQ